MENTQNQRQILASDSEDESKAQENLPNYFETLPDELYLEILKKMPKLELDSLASLCRRFNRIIQDRSLWKKVVIGSRILKRGDMGKLIRRPVQHLTLSNLIIPLLPALEATQPSWSLKEVCLDRVQAVPHDLVRMFNKCKQLTKVDLERVSVNKDVFVALSENKNIESLRMANLKGLEAVGLEILLRNARKLEKFYISSLWDNSDLFVNSICQNIAPSLLHLTFKLCFFSVKDDHIAHIVRRCPLLRRVKVSLGLSLTASSTESLSTLKHLRILEMPRCKMIPLAAYLPLTEMESLVELNIRDFRNREELRTIEQLFRVTMIEENFSARVGSFKTRFGKVVKLTY